jgi:FtsP/CotA-like multicopper oxidase with cupredoxin domain
VLIPLLALAFQVPLPDLPKARSPVTITAATLPDGRDGYVYDGSPVPPVIRVEPGARLEVSLINAMTLPSREPCVMNPCAQATNLHFHGMGVSPVGHADNVLGLSARPGDTLHYAVDIPRTHMPGLFWYHPHPHGESDRQINDGMSGAIIVEGIERFAPAVRGLRERVLVFRSVRDTAAARAALDSSVPTCGSEPEAPELAWTINSAAQPSIDIAPGERQFWRIVNASGDGFLDLAIDNARWEIVALDGSPLGGPLHTAQHVSIPPAGRLEAIVTGPSAGAALRTRCVDTGPDGDPAPAMVLAHIVTGTGQSHLPPSSAAPRRQRIPVAALAALGRRPEAVVIFTEDADGFYINARKYDPSDTAMFTVRVGSFAHWRVVNRTREVHPFHIHQVHFLTPDSLWLDTVTVPPGDSLDIVLDARNPVIRGLSVFHCHMIRHEDKGMMAKVLFTG